MKNIPTNPEELRDLIQSLLENHFLRLSNEKHMNALYPVLNDTWGVEASPYDSNEVYVELGGKGFNILVESI